MTASLRVFLAVAAASALGVAAFASAPDGISLHLTAKCMSLEAL